MSVVVEGTISANDATLLAQSAKAGAGIAFLPTYLTAPMLRSGELIALLPGYHPEEMGIHAVYLSRRQILTVVRAFIDFLADRSGEVPEWDRGLG